MSILEQFGLDELGLFRGEMCPENHPEAGDIRYRATGRCYGCYGYGHRWLTPEENDALNPLIEDAGLSSNKYKLGMLCTSGHDWRGTGRTLRYRCNRRCLECDGVTPTPELSKEERFLALIDRSGGPEACWEWQGSKNSKGYGSFRGEGKTTIAHRYSYRLYKGETPNGLVVMHSCDNRSCCNPQHLELGTQAENLADMVCKGRQARGEMRPQAKLTLEQVVRIKELGRSGIYKRSQIREMVGAQNVGVSVIGAILRGDAWAHVP